MENNVPCQRTQTQSYCTREGGGERGVSYTKTQHNDLSGLTKVTVGLSERRGEILWCVLIVQAMNRTYTYSVAMEKSRLLAEPVFLDMHLY